MKKLLCVYALLCFLVPLEAQDSPSPILFIYDASGSMWGPLGGKTKKEIAAQVLTSTVNTLPDTQHIGLMVYGHRREGDCDDIEYLYDLSNPSKAKVNQALQGINPKGRTPLARSATLAMASLKESRQKATIILITDGIESCDGDLCQIVSDAKANGIDFKLHIVGFGLKEGEKEALQCAAHAGDGRYYDADNAQGLGDVLTEATQATIDTPKPNFSLYAVKNRAPVDAWVRLKNTVTQKDAAAARTYRDTAQIYLAPGTYDIDVKALENSDIPATKITVTIKEGELLHRDVSFDGGVLEVTTTNNGEPWDAVVKMLDKTTGKVVSNTRTYGRSKEMEVPAGRYTLTYMALNLKGIETLAEVENVEVVANTTNAVSYDFKSGVAAVGVQTSNGELVDATVNFFEKTTGTNVAAGRTYTSESSNPRSFTLNPGTYDVKIMTLGPHAGHTETFALVVEKGGTMKKIIVIP